MAETEGSSQGPARERDFWGHQLQSVEEVLLEVERGPDPNTEAMMTAVGPLQGKRILDFACGQGATTAWLALAGAEVTGLDVTPEAIQVAGNVLSALGLRAELVTSPIHEYHTDVRFDAIIGRFALHHVDVAETAPRLAGLLAPGGTSAFVETMAANPILRIARNRLIGHYGIPRYGSLDEHPLTAGDLAVLEQHLGSVTYCTAQPTFLRIVDRQLLRFRSPIVSRVLAAIDDRLFAGERAIRWSYQQVICFRSVALENLI